MAPRIPPLPNRPLEVRGHGVWDPVREVFYPFRMGTTTDLVAKSGIRYYIHAMTGAFSRAGILVAANAQLNVIVGGSSRLIGTLYLPAMTQATDFCWANVAMTDIGVLADPGTAVTNTALLTHSVVYAEIPDDAAGDLQ